MEEWAGDGAPEASVVGEGGVHGEDVVDELVVGVEVCGVVEDDEQEEEAGGGEEKDFGPAGGVGHGVELDFEIRCEPGLDFHPRLDFVHGWGSVNVLK